MTTKLDVGLLQRLQAADADVAKILEQASKELRAAWAESREDRSLRPLTEAEFLRAHRHDVAWVLAKASQSIRLSEANRPSWMLALRADDTPVAALGPQALRERARRIQAVRPEGQDTPDPSKEVEAAFRAPDLVAAVQLAEEAYRLVPSSENRSYLALAYLGTGDPGAAAEQFMAQVHAFSVGIAPCHVLLNLGQALGRTGDVAGAVTWVERAAEREECGALGRLFAVWWSIQWNDADHARRALELTRERGGITEDIASVYGSLVGGVLRDGDGRVSPEMIAIVRSFESDMTPTLLRVFDEPHSA